jgi:hypothetical protein
MTLCDVYPQISIASLEKDKMKGGESNGMSKTLMKGCGNQWEGGKIGRPKGDQIMHLLVWATSPTKSKWEIK